MNSTDNIKILADEFYNNKNNRRRHTEIKECPYKKKCKHYVFSNEYKKYICKKGVCAVN